ncbi:MAG: acyltransferase family protein, partial [Treponema sp.]|nr:acyltransferase family protein [Treponema sp.]
CLFVFLGHFFVDFCIGDIFPLNTPLYRAGMLLFYGCYTVPLFCAISGFLAVQKELEKGWQLVLAAVNRFLRFELPLFFLLAAILFLNRRGLFACGDLLAQKLSNKQLAGNYTFESHYTWLFRKPFWDLHLYDNPLWMIGSLFAGNLALYWYGYASSLCRRHLKGRACTAVRAACMIILFIIARHDIPMLAVLLGGCYGLAQKRWGREDRSCPAHAKTVPAVGFHNITHILLMNVWLYFLRDFDFERFPRYYEWAGLLTALAILNLAFTVRPLQSVLAAKPLTALSSLSFAVYVVHYPLIGLLSCPLIYTLWDRIPYVPLVLLSFAATAAACFLLAFAYNRIIERPCYTVIRRGIGFLEDN